MSSNTSSDRNKHDKVRLVVNEDDEPITQLSEKSKELAALQWDKQLKPLVIQLNDIAANIQKIINPQLKLAQGLAPLLTWWQDWFRNVTPLAQVLTKWGQDIAPILKRITPILTEAGKFRETWGKWLEEEKKIAEAFKNGHFLLAPSMPMDLVQKVKTHCAAEEYRRASSIISGYYRSNGYGNLELMVQEWSDNSYFRPRKTIILDCLEAHKMGKYTLTIPALLTQIEGIASDIVKDAKSVSLGGSKPKLGKTKSVVLSIAQPDKKVLPHAIQETLIAFVEEPLYKGRDFENDYNVIRKFTGLSRHSILHGIQVKYANYTNSLRLFLTLDILFYIADGFTAETLSG